MPQPPLPADGVVKYRALHQTGELPPWADTSAIGEWFGHARKLDLIGQHPERYQGAAYGNISQRVAQGGFLITGSQTGGLDAVHAGQICWVREVDAQENRVVSLGPVPPSSEAMTHAQVYRWCPRMTFVIHVHSPDIWRQAAALGLPVTDPAAAYGTPEMAFAVKSLLHGMDGDSGALSMGGHEDGVLVFGATPVLAGERLIELAKLAGLR